MTFTKYRLNSWKSSKSNVKLTVPTIISQLNLVAKISSLGNTE